MDIKRFTLIGSMLGIASAFLGNVLFLLVDTAIRLITMCDCIASLDWIVLVFLLLCFVTLFPSMLGGMWLASMIYKDCQKQLNDLVSSTKKGLFIGVASSVVSIFFVLILISGKIGADMFALYFFETTFIGALFGALTGLVLKSIFLRNTRHFTGNKT